MKALSLDSSIAGVGVAIVRSSGGWGMRSRAGVPGPGIDCNQCCSPCREMAIGYFSGVVPGVALLSSGEGWMCPSAFSGVLERTEVGPGPAVPGLSPLGPEGSTAWRFASGDRGSTGIPIG